MKLAIHFSKFTLSLVYFQKFYISLDYWNEIVYFVTICYCSDFTLKLCLYIFNAYIWDELDNLKFILLECYENSELNFDNKQLSDSSIPDLLRLYRRNLFGHHPSIINIRYVAS